MRFVPILRGVLVVAVGVLALAGKAAAQPYQLYPILPCRIVDTRNPIPDGGALLHAVQRDLQIAGRCGVGAGAKAAALNLVVLGPSSSGHLVMWPYTTTYPQTSNINYTTGVPALANGTVMMLTSGGLNVSVLASLAGGPGHSLHFIVDVTGYFQ